jgi:cytochrome c oxidase subunit 2
LTGAAQFIAQAIAVARQSALKTGGPSAERIGALWNLMLWSSIVVTVLVLLALAWAIWRPRQSGLLPEADRPADARGDALNDESGGRGLEETGRPRTERIGARVMVGAGAIVPAVILGVLLVITMRVLAAVSLPSHALAQPDDPPRPGELTVKVTGRQYWWEVEYLDAEAQRRFETANELRIPVGRRVIVRLATDDVIHSFWVPGLGGKMDLVPGRTNVMFIEASRPGVWRGQCAEFCGVQHAKMAFVVVAEPPDRWEMWAAQQRLPAPVPRDSLALADTETFLTSGCVLCHAVRGTPARGELGPDLTHLASRLTLAAGTLPNTTGHRYGWIANPQAIKPGNKMPAVALSPQQLDAIVRYLDTLR